MIEALALSFGALTSFVVAGVERNHRERRPHPPILSYVGYALCGALGMASAGLTAVFAGNAMGLL